MPDWCGCSTEYLPVLEGSGWLVKYVITLIGEPGQTANPPRGIPATAPAAGEATPAARPSWQTYLGQLDEVDQRPESMETANSP